MALIAVAKNQNTILRYYPYPFDNQPHHAILKDLNFRSAYDIPSRMQSRASEWFFANDSNYNDIRKLREYPRLVYVPYYSADNPPRQPFYLFILSGKGWEIWKLKPEAFSLLLKDHSYHLCVLIARSATDDEISPPSDIVFTDAFYRKSGQVSFYVNEDELRAKIGYDVNVGAYMIFYPLKGLDGTQGYAIIRGSGISFGRFTDSVGNFTTPELTSFTFVYLTVDGNTILILPTPLMLTMQPQPTPPVPAGSIFVTSKSAIFAHYEGIPMNGKVVAPTNVTSGQVTTQRKFLQVRLYRGLNFNFWEEDFDLIKVPKLGCGIWALPSEDPYAKLGGYNYYSLSDIGAELVEQHIFDFFEPQVTFKVSSRDDKCLYVGVWSEKGLEGGYDFFNPAFLNKSPSAEVVSLPVGKMVFSFGASGNYSAPVTFLDDGAHVTWGGTTGSSGNYLRYSYEGSVGYSMPPIVSIIEGEFNPKQKNRDVRFNVALMFALPKESELRVMTTYLNPSFATIASFFHIPYMPFRGNPRQTFASLNLNELLASSPARFTVGGLDWVHPNAIFYPNYNQIGYAIDMPVGACEVLIRSDKQATDTGRGGETVKVLVWQPVWFSHSFTADRDYGDILMQFGWKITTIASPPQTEYVTGGIMVASAWFQNLLRRLRGADLKDADKHLLRDCVCSLDGFWGAIRVTVHYDRQSGLIYMREWRLGVPYGSPVPLTTFSLQPYHEIRAIKDVWAWAFYVDIMDTRTHNIVKRIKVSPTRVGWRVSDVSPSQPIAFTHRKSFVNPLIGVNPSSPYRADPTLNFHHIIGRSPHTLNSPNLTNINDRIYAYGNYPQRFYPLKAPVENLRGVPQQFMDAAQKVYGSQVPVVPVQFGNLNARPIYVAHIPMVVEIKKKRDVPSEIIAKWGIGVALFMAGDRWVEMLSQGLADLGELLHWTVTELWESEP
jgi:hypothetical protein